MQLRSLLAWRAAVRHRLEERARRFKLALVLVGVFAAIAVTGASAADFETDTGPCPETPGNGSLLRCPTAIVGEEYEVEIESEEGSGCTSAGNPYVWYEIVNSTLPPGLSMTRAGVISGVPTSGVHTLLDLQSRLDRAQGGPDWCQREDVSEKEFSIFVDPGLEIDNESVQGATIGQAYSETLSRAGDDSECAQCRRGTSNVVSGVGSAAFRRHALDSRVLSGTPRPRELRRSSSRPSTATPSTPRSTR
jgi:hypothetical protein